MEDERVKLTMLFFIFFKLENAVEKYLVLLHLQLAYLFTGEVSIRNNLQTE